jgi:hypothetical protein
MCKLIQKIIQKIKYIKIKHIKIKYNSKNNLKNIGSNVRAKVKQKRHLKILGVCRSGGGDHRGAAHHRVQRQEGGLLLHPAQELLQSGESEKI